MTIPDWWEFAILGLGAFRIWRLIAVDTITEPLRDRVFRMAEYKSGNEERYRFKLDEFVSCPWCFGWWIVLATWALWQIWPHGVVVALTPFALSTVVGFLAKADS